MHAVLRPPGRVDEHDHVASLTSTTTSLDEHQADVVDQHPEHDDALAPAGCCRLVPARPPTEPVPIGGTMEPVTIGEELLEERRRRRRAGDPRITPEGRELLLRMTTGDLMDEFQAALDADLAADPILGGHDTDDDV
jgi:hypothetical protein